MNSLARFLCSGCYQTDETREFGALAEFAAPRISISKCVLQCDLHLAHIRARRSDGAETRVGNGIIGITPVWMVWKVKRFKPELERLTLDHAELLMY